MPESSGHYIHGSDPEEQRRLSMLNALMNRSSLEALRLRGGEVVLDVGSGLGQLTRAMARAVGDGGRVVAIERDAAQLATARRDCGGAEEQRIDFRQGDATVMPLLDEEWGSFDVVHTRFVLEHVKDPAAVVAAMVRAARPGGRIVLEDDDHEALQLWPPAPAFERLWHLYAKSYEVIGNDPIVGRKLVSLLHAAGATPWRNDRLFFGCCRGDERFDSFLANLLGVIETARGVMLESGLISAADYEEARREAEAWAQLPDAALWYQTSWAEGRKPGSLTVPAAVAAPRRAGEAVNISPLELLVESVKDLSSSLELAEVFRKIACRIQQLVEHHLLCVMLWNEKTQLLEHSYSLRFGEHIAQVGGFQLGQGISGSAAQDRQAIRVKNVGLDPRYVRYRHAEVEIRSELAIPLLVQDRLIGVIDIESTEFDSFSEEHENLLTALASQIAIALENARLYEAMRANEKRMEEDLALARRLQGGLLPQHPPAVAGFEVGALCAPAKELSGDFYDLFETAAGGIAVVVGDVAGKSTAAALFGALAVGSLRENAAKWAESPAEMLGHVDLQLRPFRNQGRFLAMVYGAFDAETRSVVIANAGVPLPLLVRRGQMQEIEVKGPPLGTLLPRQGFAVEKLILEPGDLVVFVSDGVEDCLNAAEKPFGREGLATVLEKAGNAPAQQIASSLLAATDAWAAGGEIADDRSIVVVRVV